jgi:hypothetical protein
MGMKRHPEHHVEFYEWAPGMPDIRITFRLSFYL